MDAETKVAERKSVRRTQQRVRRANALVKTAATIVKGERKCNGSVKVLDEHGNPITGPDGKWLRRPCKRAPIIGGSVCHKHGGRAPQVKRRAQERLLAMVEPSLVRLGALIHQDEHLPTALGAIRTVLERAGDNAIGALKKVETQDTRPVINIGIRVGGIETRPDVTVGLLPAADNTDFADTEGAIVGNNGDDADE